MTPECCRIVNEEVRLLSGKLSVLLSVLQQAHLVQTGIWIVNIYPDVDNPETTMTLCKTPSMLKSGALMCLAWICAERAIAHVHELSIQ